MSKELRIEFVGSALTSTKKTDEIYPWGTATANSRRPDPRIEKTDDCQLVIKTDYQSQLQTVFGILTGGIASALFTASFSRTKKVSLQPSSIVKIVRFTRRHPAAHQNWPDELKKNPPQQQIVYHVFVQTTGEKTQVHIFTLRWTMDLDTRTAYESAQRRLDDLITSEFPAERIVDEKKQKPAWTHVDTLCFWTKIPVKGAAASYKDYVDYYQSEDRTAIVGYVCPKCGIVSSSTTDESGIAWRFWSDFRKCKCAKCGAQIPDPKVVIPEEKIPEWDENGKILIEKTL
jgi:hypothetical protein